MTLSIPAYSSSTYLVPHVPSSSSSATTTGMCQFPNSLTELSSNVQTTPINIRKLRQNLPKKHRLILHCRFSVSLHMPFSEQSRSELMTVVCIYIYIRHFCLVYLSVPCFWIEVL